jgi:hypothetical protein
MNSRLALGQLSRIFCRKMSHARIEGTVVRVNRRGKNLFSFEGQNLSKLGRADQVSVEFADTRYTGELVAIAPTRAILQISPAVAGHGIVPAAATVAQIA